MFPVCQTAIIGNVWSVWKKLKRRDGLVGCILNECITAFTDAINGKRRWQRSTLLSSTLSFYFSLSISLFLVLIQRLRVATTDAYANELLVHVHASENPNIRKKPALNGKMMIASVELLWRQVNLHAYGVTSLIGASLTLLKYLSRFLKLIQTRPVVIFHSKP